MTNLNIINPAINDPPKDFEPMLETCPFQRVGYSVSLIFRNNTWFDS